MKRLLALTALLLATSVTWAEDELPATAPSPDEAPRPAQSERLHQALAGRFDLTPEMDLDLASTDFTGADMRRETIYEPIILAGEYGINANFSVGMLLAYAQTLNSYSCGDFLNCPDNTATGLEDPEFFVKSQWRVGPGTLRVGLTASVALEHAKIKDADGDTNQASGGDTITPFLAYEMPVGPGILGARLRYDVYQSARKVDDSSGPAPVSYTRTGGQEFRADAFYEYTLHKLTYGGALIYEKSNPINTNALSVIASNNYAISTYGFDTYFPVHFTPDIVLLPSAGLRAYSFSSDATISYQTEFTFGCGARFTF